MYSSGAGLEDHPTRKKLGQKQQLDDRTKECRRSERRRAANRLQDERENPINRRAENSRRVVVVISIVLIALFVYLLSKYEF